MAITPEATTWIAIYGAFLSTVALGWNIIFKCIEKAKVKVKVTTGFTMSGDQLSEQIIDFRAVNIRKRPIHLTSFGIVVDTNETLYFMTGTKLPKILQDAQTHEFHIPIKKFVQDLNNKKPVYAFFRDSTGKEHKSSKRAMRKFFKNFVKKKRQRSDAKY